MRMIFTLLVLLAILPLGLKGEELKWSWNGDVADGFASGSGTQIDPYIIKTAGQLAYFATLVDYSVRNGFTLEYKGDNFAGKYIRLDDDIYLNEISSIETLPDAPQTYIWKPICPETSDETECFCGTFDGNGHKIIGLYMSSVSTDGGLGLFGRLGEGGKIKNLILEDGYIKKSSEENASVGTFVLRNYGIIENCKNYCIIDSDLNSAYVGGIVAGNYGEINNCENYGNITCEQGDVGGIAGISEGKISNSYNKGKVEGFNDVGGIVGNLDRGRVENSFNEGEIKGADYVGGICGRINNGGNFLYCCNIGNINCEGSNKGGICSSADKDNMSYYLDSTCPGAEDNECAVSIEQFKSGEVAAGLGSAWAQNLGESEYPVLKFFYPSEPTVYSVKFIVLKYSVIEEVYEAKYANAGALIYAPENDPSPENENEKFMGWSNSKYSFLEIEEPIVVDSENKSFYAHFAEFYTINFDPNGGSGSMDKLELFCKDNDEADTQEPLTSNKYKKQGYTFTGWSTDANGEVIYEDNATAPNSEEHTEITLYAQWKANTYEVKFEANGGEGTMDIMQLTYDQSKALTKNKYTKAGYTFVGWSAEQGGEVKYSDEEFVKNLAVSGEIVLYAKWEAIPVVITYHDLHITESVGAKLVSRNDKDRTPDGGSFTLSLEKEEGYEDCEPTVYYKRGRFGEWKELKLDEVSGYYQIRSVYTDIYVKVSGDGIWPVSNEKVEAQEVKVYTQNGAIVVSTPSLMDVQIISMTGSVVAADKVAGQREFRNIAEGIYVVRVGEEVVKVRL